ncbi:hypothetical protein BDZ88DRAFT_427638 [Geranomyces variabilis]|nr:hypothetical protein BDZ88DRAFT_427638 [Geranomyces variabilis]
MTLTKSPPSKVTQEVPCPAPAPSFPRQNLDILTACKTTTQSMSLPRSSGLGQRLDDVFTNRTLVTESHALEPVAEPEPTILAPLPPTVELDHLETGRHVFDNGCAAVLAPTQQREGTPPQSFLDQPWYLPSPPSNVERLMPDMNLPARGVKSVIRFKW